jgi:hypothetical protein
LFSTTAASDNPQLILENSAAGRYLPSLLFKSDDGFSTGAGTNSSRIVGGFEGGNTYGDTVLGFDTTLTGAGTLVRAMTIKNGNVGIGKSPGYLLELNTDSSGKPGVGGLWTVVSDERIKKDISDADLDRCYEIVKITPLRHFSFADGVYSDDQIKDKANLGWIAQDVQKVFPKATNVIPFTKAEKIPDGQEEYEEQDFTIETVEKEETSIEIIDGKAVHTTKIVSEEVKTMLFDTVNVVDKDDQPVMTSVSAAVADAIEDPKVVSGKIIENAQRIEKQASYEPLIHQVPRMVKKTRDKFRQDVIEDCLDLNGGQMVMAMFGAVQKTMSVIEDLQARIAVLEGGKVEPIVIGKVEGIK